jgi:hypothetical protein
MRHSFKSFLFARGDAGWPEWSAALYFYVTPLFLILISDCAGPGSSAIVVL